MFGRWNQLSGEFPVDAPKAKVLKALAQLGFRVVREREHISLVRENADGANTPMTIPNHSEIKGSTLRRICTQAGLRVRTSWTRMRSRSW